ncbi:hypothetical protein [Neptunomonas antarctica]|nr:hypothetical protein [Neptunomonas antarctica]
MNYRAPSTSQVSIARHPSRGTPAILLLIVSILAYFLYQILHLDVREWQKTLLVMGYLVAVWTVITKL